MDNEKISDLINSIAQGKALESEAIFNELAMARVQDRMAENVRQHHTTRTAVQGTANPQRTHPSP
jgi:hypothetical protein